MIVPHGICPWTQCRVADESTAKTKLTRRCHRRSKTSLREILAVSVNTPYGTFTGELGPGQAKAQSRGKYARHTGFIYEPARCCCHVPPHPLV
jgi:hypothetical protein